MLRKSRFLYKLFRFIFIGGKNGKYKETAARNRPFKYAKYLIFFFAFHIIIFKVKYGFEMKI